jgi:hypothetical protein
MLTYACKVTYLLHAWDEVDALGLADAHHEVRLVGMRRVHPHEPYSPREQAYVSIRQHTSAYVSIRQHTSAYVSIRQHTSAYVSRREHTSAYVSIRQHTSVVLACSEPTRTKFTTDQHTRAYVSIRQHTSAYVSLIGMRRANAVALPLILPAPVRITSSFLRYQ